MTRVLRTQTLADPTDSAQSPSDVPPQESRTAGVLSRGCSLVAFLLPIKLSLTYIVLAPLILFWAYTNRARLTSLQLSEHARRIVAPLIAFLALAALSGAVGVSPNHSLPALASLLFFVLTIPVFASHAGAQSVCLALIAGQTVAAAHSLLEAAMPHSLPRLFLGKVTESGQLAITIPLTLGVIASNLRSRASFPSTLQGWRLPLLAITIATSCTLIGFQSDLSLSRLELSMLVFIAGASLLAAWQQVRISPSALVRQHVALFTLSAPLLTCALLVNLKRGPWLGVLVGTSCLLLVYARRLVLPLALSAILLGFSITPIRDRLLASYEHFTIAGGRSTIWRIGAELASEYPLGIGYHNSGILREFAPEIPAELKHFHNNLLNIAAETGWLGALVFLWLLLAVVKTCLRDRYAPLYVAIGCAIISWQVAGLVEYNFGDSEVTILVWVLLGLVLQRDVRAS